MGSRVLLLLIDAPFPPPTLEFVINLTAVKILTWTKCRGVDRLLSNRSPWVVLLKQKHIVVSELIEID